MKVYSSKCLDVYLPDSESEVDVVELPFVGQVKAGFPSPASDFLDTTIDLNRYLIKNKPSTYLARAKGDSMIKAGIFDGDLLVIDKSLDIEDNRIAVCYIDGEFTVKQIKLEDNRCWLMPANDEYKPIEVFEESQLIVWGIVTFAIKELLCTR